MAQLTDCPECQAAYTTHDSSANLPTCCQWCLYTMCTSCFDTRGLPKAMPCPHCGKHKANKNQRPIVHDFSRQLLLQNTLLQEKQAELEAQLLTAATTTAGTSSTATTTAATTTTAEQPSANATTNKATNNKATANKAAATRPTNAYDKLYPKGQKVKRNGRWGEIQAVSLKTNVFLVQYGTGDPHWVPQSAMERLVRDASKKQAQQGHGGGTVRATPHNFRHGRSLSLSSYMNPDPRSFVGQAVYKHFVGMGFFWGKVRDFRVDREYTVTWFDNTRTSPQEERIEARDMPALVADAAATSANNRISSMKKAPPVLRTSVAADGSSKRGPAEHDPTDDTLQPSLPKKARGGSNYPISLDGQSSDDSSPSLVRDTAMEDKASNNIDDAMAAKDDLVVEETDRRDNAVMATRDDLESEETAVETRTIGKGLALSVRAQGTGWKGFDTYITESTLPCKFKDILNLMDFLFPVAAGEDTFLFGIYEKSAQNPIYKSGYHVRMELRKRKSKDPNLRGFRWHTLGADYVPPSKKDLAGFMELLMSLDMAPKLDDQNDSRQAWQQNQDGSYTERKRKTPSQMCAVVTHASTTTWIGPLLSLPTEAEGTGWEGFDRHISDLLPSSLERVVQLTDFLFQVAEGEQSIQFCLWDKRHLTVGPKGGSGDPGQELRVLLRKADPNTEGLQWHKKNCKYVPPSKECLAGFIGLLLRLDIAPRLKKPEDARHLSIENQDGGSSVMPPKDYPKGHNDVMQLSKNMHVPMDARGTGWKGLGFFSFSNTCRPKRLREVFLLMDFFFPVATGEDTFVYHFFDKTGELYGRPGHALHEKLRILHIKSPDLEGLKWHSTGSAWVPQTKTELAAFVDLLLDLGRAPPKLGQPKLRLAQEKSPGGAGSPATTPQSVGAPQKVPVLAGDPTLLANSTTNRKQLSDLSEALGLPEEAWGTGWGGFHCHIGTALPTKFRDVFLLVDILFPVAQDEELFVSQVFDESLLATTLQPGHSIRQALRNLKDNEPNVAGLNWHHTGHPYVPQTKKDLASFMGLLIGMAQKSATRRAGRPPKVLPSDEKVAKRPRGRPRKDESEFVPIPPETVSRSPKGTPPKNYAEVTARTPSPDHSHCSTVSFVPVGGTYALPGSAMGTGWSGFEEHVSDEHLPKTAKAVLETMDCLFAFEDRDETFVDRFWTKPNGRPGVDMYNKLTKLQTRFPEHKGLKWYTRKQFAPETKEDLREFVKVLVSLYNGEYSPVADIDASPASPAASTYTQEDAI